MKSYAQILSRLLNCPLMVHPQTAIVIYNILAEKSGMNMLAYGEHNPPIQPKSSRFVGDWVESSDPGKFPRVEPFKRTPEGVGIITVDGELVNRGAWIGANSGLVSYEGTKFQLARAAKDPKTRAILLDINSPGGEAVGAMEMAMAVRQARDAKPVYAVANGMAASAAYAMASGASRIFAAPTSMTGSIGVVMLHMDYSGALEQAGVTPTLIFAGAHKVDGNPVEPLTEGVAAELQAGINQFYDAFLATVAEGRGRRLSTKAARATEARTYLGADAVATGLADAMGTFEEALSEITSKVVRASARSIAAKAASTQGKTTMAGEQTETEIAIAEAAARGRSEGQTAGMQAATDRINAILADPRVKGHETYALKMAGRFTSASAADIGEMCAELPKPLERGTLLGMTVEETGVNNIQPGSGGQQQPGSRADVAANWDKVVAKVNQRVPQRASS